MKISRIVLSLFLFAAGCAFGYWIISSWIFFDFHWSFLLYFPAILLVVVLPIYSSVGLIVSDIKKIRSGESTNFYEN